MAEALLSGVATWELREAKDGSRESILATIGTVVDDPEQGRLPNPDDELLEVDVVGGPTRVVEPHQVGDVLVREVRNRRLQDEPGLEFICSGMAERPISLEDVEHLDKISTRINVGPITVIFHSLTGETHATTLWIADRLDRTILLFGYSPDVSSWVLVEEWPDGVPPDRVTATAEQWIGRRDRDALEEALP